MAGRVKSPNNLLPYNSQEASMDIIMKIVEKLMERITMDNRPLPRENQEQRNINQNFRRSLPPPRNQRIHKVPL